MLYLPLPSRLTATDMLVFFCFSCNFSFSPHKLTWSTPGIYLIAFFINKSDLAIEDQKLVSTYNIMNTAEKWHGTTIVLLRKNGETIVAGDGQVSLGNTVLKSKAKKVRKIEKEM